MHRTIQSVWELQGRVYSDLEVNEEVLSCLYKVLNNTPLDEMAHEEQMRLSGLLDPDGDSMVRL